ncbi:MAG: RNA methyltransferase [Magnetococcales bacterium]|nr:RNA methyltransferase [Magnetococcales bacterium]
MEESIVVILDRPAQPGNIGACARAMANMGLNRLRLVNPREFPHTNATEFAVGASWILEESQVFSSLDAALEDRNFLVATTNRTRGQRQVVVTPRELGERMPAILARPETRVGLLFGTERTGLETRDVERADWICNIPTTGVHGSLNLAQAVLILGYEIMLGRGLGHTFALDPTTQGPRAGAADLEHMFDHLEQVLRQVDFLKPQQKGHLMGSIKAIFHRAAMDKREVAIMRGIINEIGRPPRPQDS